MQTIYQRAGDDFAMRVMGAEDKHITIRNRKHIGVYALQSNILNLHKLTFSIEYLNGIIMIPVTDNNDLSIICFYCRWHNTLYVKAAKTFC